MILKIINENNKRMETNETNKGNIVISFLKKKQNITKKRNETQS
jgi:hypothetical protein